jgi:hypothetical protein
MRTHCAISTLYLVKVIAIPGFFQEFLKNSIQEFSRFPNFEYEVIWRTFIRTE